jgi:hypothetical protein
MGGRELRNERQGINDRGIAIEMTRKPYDSEMNRLHFRSAKSIRRINNINIELTRRIAGGVERLVGSFFFA